MKRIILLGLVCGLLAGNAGCGLLSGVLCPGWACNPRYCAPAPGLACPQPCAMPCEPTCGTVPVPSCDQPCCPPPITCGPLTWVLGLFEAGCWYGGGCGEAYCGDPPDCCDPCDRWGNYTGGGVGGYYGGYAAGTAPQQFSVGPAPEVAQTPAATRQ